jgi:protein-disulfide isomerase
MSKLLNTNAKGSRLARKEQRANMVGVWIIGISAVVVLLVVLAVAWQNRPRAVSIAAPDIQAEWLGRTTMGNPDASITVQMWEDFFCPACFQWTEQIKPQFVEEFVKTGQVLLEFHHFPLQSHEPASKMAAMAAECAADQGAFWQFHDRLFAAQSSGQAGYTIDALVRYASELGLDSSAMLQCMSSQQYRAKVDDSFNQALSLGLNATPSMLINGKRMENPFDLNAVKAEIDSLLAAEN